MPRCLIALGSNLGERVEILRAALQRIAQLPKTTLLARSRWHETAAIGGPEGQRAFLNGAALIDTCLSPEALHGQLIGIEMSQGRIRAEHWGPRTLDLDLLLCDGHVCRTSVLELPHPRMSYRRFVLEPADEIAGWMLHPTSGWTIAQLLRHLDRAANCVAVTASDAQAAKWMAKQLASSLGCLHIEGTCPLEMFPGGTSDSATVEFAQAVISCSCGLEDLVLRWPRPKLLVAWLAGVENEQKTGPFQSRSSYGPMARIDTNQRQQALAEVLAAIQAVWPR